MLDLRGQLRGLRSRHGAWSWLPLDSRGGGSVNANLPVPSAATVAVVGLGNIGSRVVEQLGRLPGSRASSFVDRDRYEASNLTSRGDFEARPGVPKAMAARVLRALNPALEVLRGRRRPSQRCAGATASECHSWRPGFPRGAAPAQRARLASGSSLA